MSDHDNDGNKGVVADSDVRVTGIKAVDNISGANAQRTQGVYTGVASTGGTGTGAKFTVTVDGNGAATIAVHTTGVNYGNNNTLTIADSLLGGGGAPDLTFDVNGVGLGTYTYSPDIYKLDLVADDTNKTDFFGDIQETIPLNTYAEYKDESNHILDLVNEPDKLVTRPSTAINFAESDYATYRSVAFSNKDAFSTDLANDEIMSTFEAPFDFVQIQVDTTKVTTVDPDDGAKRMGQLQGDTKIAIVEMIDARDITRLTRDVLGRQPGDAGYSGGMVFAHDGKFLKERALACFLASGCMFLILL